MLRVQTKLESRIALIKQRMHRAVELSAHRPAETHVAIAQQLAPRDTGLMADTTHKVPEESTGRYAEVIAPQFYSGFVEFGTVRAPAQPWFLPAFVAAVNLFKAGAPLMVDTVLRDGEPPLQTVGVVRSVSQRQAPATGVVRKVRQ